MARKKNDIVFENIEVIDAGAKGKSVAKAPDGRVIFMTDAVPGDIVDVRTIKKRKAFYEARVTKIKKASSRRTEPVCKHFTHCGGCKWQHMKYEDQLFFKQKEVINNLQRIGHLTLPKATPILGAENIYFYRNKMEFSFSNNRWLSLEEIQGDVQIENKNALGFHIAGMWDKILDIEKCHLQEDPSNQIRNSIKAFAEKNDLTFFNPRAQEGLLRTLMLRISSTGEIMVLIQFFEDQKEKISLLMDYLVKTFPEITSLQYVINQKANDTIYDQKVILHHGEPFIYEEMEGLRFKINAKSFYQTNSAQAYELYKITRDFANLTGEEVVYDLYTGTGTIAQFISKQAKKVVGIESVPEAIADANDNAKMNKIDHIDFFVGDMAKIFTDEFIEKNGKPDVIITDPPRDGMHKNVIEQLLKIGADRIVYVSCNSATQARDLALMDEHYKIEKTQAVDMFPQTHHVENVVLLTKR